MASALISYFFNPCPLFSRHTGHFFGSSDTPGLFLLRAFTFAISFGMHFLSLALSCYSLLSHCLYTALSRIPLCSHHSITPSCHLLLSEVILYVYLFMFIVCPSQLECRPSEVRDLVCLLHCCISST